MKRKHNSSYFKSGDINNLNADLPLNLRELEPVINEIVKKCPLLKKSEISLIVKCFIEELREQLVKGKIINLKDLLMNMQLYTFCKLKNNKLMFNTRVQVTTPRHIKNANVIK